MRVFFYLEDCERTLDSPTDKITLSLTTFADELEREKARQRTYDAMQRKARAGHLTGGRVFGYDNVEVVGADGQRSHVERRINEGEAAVVRRIFELCAAGAGLTRITKTLNAEHVPAPRAQQGRPIAWAPSSVRSVLLRPLSRGEIVWNQSRKRDSWGQAKRSERPEEAWLRVPAPQLPLVSERLWMAAHRQRERREKQYGAGERGHRASRYLLSGFARCAVCGGGFASHTRDHGSRRGYFYGCITHWKRGACRNAMLAPMAGLDAEVLATLQDDILRPTVIEQVLAIALEERSPKRQSQALATLERELTTVRAECERLAEAIGRGGPLDALLERLRGRQARRQELEALLAGRQTLAAPVAGASLDQRLRAKLADWRGLLTRNVESGRDVLRALLAGPLRFTPIDEARRSGYAFDGSIALDRLVSGVIDLVPRTGVASPTGTVDGWPMWIDGFGEARAA